MALEVPSCPRCETNLHVRCMQDIGTTGIVSYWACNFCGSTFCRKEKIKKMQYMILRNPKTYENSAPKRFFDTLEQATEVAKKMAIEHRDTFYVIKLIKKVSLPEVIVSVEDL